MCGTGSTATSASVAGWRSEVSPFHSRVALRDVHGEAVRPPRHVDGYPVRDPNLQAAHRVAGALQERGAVLTPDSVRVLCRLVWAWPSSDEGPSHENAL